MNRMTRVITTFAVAATSVGVAAGTASAATASAATGAAAPQAPVVADPHTLSTDLMPGVRYTGNTADHSVVISTPIGTLTSQGAQVQVQDNQGRTVYGQPFATPPKAAVTTQPAGPLTAPAAVAGMAVTPVSGPLHDVDANADFSSALSTAATNFGLATGVGGMVGGVAGAAVGCPVGVVTGGTLTGVVSLGTLTPLGVVGGCVAGASVVGSLGTIVGGAVAGVPVGIASAAQAYNTLHAQGHV
jgi:hypothetical protein